MPSLTDVYVTVKADTENFDRDLKKKLRGVDRDGKRLGGSIGKSIGGGMRMGIAGPLKAMAGMMAGVFAGVQLGKMFVGFVQEAREAEKISRLTAAAIKSTGGAANISADQVSALAEAISNKTAVDDEAIQSGANLLLTFTKVRNEVGAGNDIFNQATAAALDMSVALGTDMKSASLQLGKALNDPIRGVTALTRSGVSFTEQQKEQIKTLVESGRTLDAQKIILSEMTKQFGGAAAAAADPLDRLRVIAGNLGERIGSKLLPYVEKAATWLGERLPRAFDTVVGWFKQFQRGSDDGGKAAGHFTTHAERLGAAVRTVSNFFRDEVTPRVKEFEAFIREQVIPRLQKLSRDVLPSLQKFLDDVRWATQRVTDAFKGADASTGDWSTELDWLVRLLGGAVKVALTTLGNNLRLIGTIVGTVITATRTLRQIWTDVMVWMARQILDTGERVLRTADKMMGWVPGIGPKIKEAVRQFEIFRDGANRALAGVKNRTVSIDIGATQKTVKLAHRAGVQELARGGPVFGAGTATSDSIPALLSNGEHVLTAREVRAAGGHDAIMEWRKSLRGFAAGGPVVRDLASASVRGASRYLDRVAEKLASSMAKRIGQSLADKIAAFPGDQPGQRTANGVGGLGPAARRAAAAVREVFGFRGTIGGYANRNIAGTNKLSKHALGKAIDVMTYSNMSLGRNIANYFLANRDRFGVDNIIFNRRITNRGRGWQWGRYMGANPHTDHPHIDFFDGGGWLKPGVTLAANNTGKPERVRTDEQDKRVERLLAALERGGLGDRIEINAPTTSAYELVDEVQKAKNRHASLRLRVGV
jgi:hypothetical protein